MKLSTSSMVLAVLGLVATVSAAPAPGGFGKNAFANNAANAAALNNANAAVKTNNFNNHAAVNQGFAFNQAKKNTNAATVAAQKNHNNLAKKNSKKAAAFNNFGFPGFKGKAFGAW